MTKIDLTRLPLLAIALFALAACGSKDDTPAVAQPAAQAEAQPESAPAEAAPEPEAAPIAAIEESDGSVDPAEEDTESLRLAQADVPLSAVPASRFREGQHYNRWRPARMKVTGTDGVEVTEVFWYGCSTCNKFEPLLNRWVPDLPQGVEFVKLPAVWNPTLLKHAQLYYTIEALANAGNLQNAAAVHAAVFNAIHVEKRNAVTATRDMVALLGRFGVSEADFEWAWKSPWVTTRVNQAKRLNDTYDVGGVPTIVVNGKYVVNLKTTLDSMLAVTDELVAAEQTR